MVLVLVVGAAWETGGGSCLWELDKGCLAGRRNEDAQPTSDPKVILELLPAHGHILSSGSVEVVSCPQVDPAGLSWCSLSSRLSKYATGIQGTIQIWKKHSWESMTDNKPRLHKDHYNLE